MNNNNGIAKEYRKFSTYYQSVGEVKNHFNAQFILLKKYIDKGNKQIILDASCATGNVLEKLIIEYPQSEFYGSDLCKSFIDIAKQQLPHVTDNIKKIDWLELSKYYKKEKFDLVYILGNSISHCESLNEFEKIIFQVRAILKKKGKLLFDLRDWELNKKEKSFNEPYSGNTIQVNDGILKFTFSTKYIFKDDKYLLIHNIYDNTKEIEIDLRFLKISENKISEILKKSGFCNITINKDFFNYPFILVESEKCK